MARFVAAMVSGGTGVVLGADAVAAERFFERSDFARGVGSFAWGFMQ